MANTKKLEDRAFRKGVKRSQRKKLVELEATLTHAQRKKLRKEPMGLRKFMAEQQQAQAKEG